MFLLFFEGQAEDTCETCERRFITWTHLEKIDIEKRRERQTNNEAPAIFKATVNSVNGNDSEQD